LVVYRVHHDSATRIFSLPIRYAVGDRVQPTLSPDLARVAFITTDESGGARLWVGPLEASPTQPIEPVFTGAPVSSFAITGLQWLPDGHLILSTAGLSAGGLLDAGTLWQLDDAGGARQLGQGAFHRILGLTHDPNLIMVARRLSEGAEQRSEGWGLFHLSTQTLEALTFTAEGERAFYLWQEVVAQADGTVRAVTLYIDNAQDTPRPEAPARVLSLEPGTGEVSELWSVPAGSHDVGPPVWEPGATGRFAVASSEGVIIVDASTGTAQRIHSPMGRLLTWAPQGIVTIDDKTHQLRLLTREGLVIGEIDLSTGGPDPEHARYEGPTSPSGSEPP